MKIKLILSICLTSIIIFSNITSSADIPQAKNQLFETNSAKVTLANWTLLYYLAADNHLSSETGPLVENLSAIGSNKYMNIVILRDDNEKDDTILYHVNNNGSLKVLNKQFGWPDEVDTSDTNTLKLFTEQMMEAYPAKYYALIIFAAGGAGWQHFALHDNDSDIGPTMPEFANVMKDITKNGANKIDILVTPCITGMIEVAYELAPYAKYLSTTEEHTPDGYLHYMRFYKAVIELRNNTGLKPDEFASIIPKKHEPVVFSFFKENFITNILNKLPFHKLHSVKMYTTSSIVNLSLISNLSSEVDRLSSMLILNMKFNNEVNTAIQKARSDAREYGKGYAKYGFSLPFLNFFKNCIHSKLPLEGNSFDSFIDLYHFAEMLYNYSDNAEIKNQCVNVMKKLDESIIAEKSFPYDNSNGLSIYFPDNKYLYNRYIFGGKKAPSLYEEQFFSKDTTWDDFIKAYLGI